MCMELIAEFLGSFFFIAVALMAGSPLTVGVGLVGAVYFVSSYGKAHLNPAVSLASYLGGKMSGGDMSGYVAMQLLGGILALAWARGAQKTKA